MSKSMKRAVVKICMVFVFISAIILSFGIGKRACAQKIKLRKTKIAVGERTRVKTPDREDYVFTSSNTLVAFVNDRGFITGKRAGKAMIKVKRPGHKVHKFRIQVQKRKKKPEKLPVCIDEAELVPVDMQEKEDGTMEFSAYVRNLAEKGMIQKIEYHYQITQSGENGEIKDVCLVAEKIHAGENSAVVKCEGDASGVMEAMQPVKIKLYTGDALYVYDAQDDVYRFRWGREKTVPPVISGWVGENSYSRKDIYRVYYSDRKNTYSFKEHVKAVDAHGNKVKVKVDTSGINWKKSGVYKIKYTATDKNGNTAKAWAKAQVYVKKNPEKIADDILKKITKKNWSDTKKARAIYKYIQTHHSYVGRGSRANWRTVGAENFRSQSGGDCYTYYSMARLLLTRAGIPNIMIKREPAPAGHPHWWNLVYVQGGWYHFDTTPRARSGYFCLVTDAQLKGYSTGYTFRFKESAYPKRATKRISRNP